MTARLIGMAHPYHADMTSTLSDVSDAALATEVDARIDAIASELVAFRRDLHQHPELSYQEHRTSALVAAELAKLPGMEVKAGLAGGTGVVAHLPATDGASSRPAVALRADMDALPIKEATGLPHASTTPGVMHACGHDGHTAILLGAARVLASLDRRPNPVTFIFQPAEENGGGGEQMCLDGALDGGATNANPGGVGPKVDRIFGLHGWPQVPLGMIGSKAGPMLAATDDFHVTVRGVGGHAAMPHMLKDPVLAASACVVQLQSIASRVTNPLEPIVCTVSTIHGGVVDNVVPDTVELTGTIRTLRDNTRAEARAAFFRIVEQTAQAHGCEADIDWKPGYPVTHNDVKATAQFFHAAEHVVAAEHVFTVPEPFMGGEDFSYYGQRVPACFFLLGLLPDGQDADAAPKLHQPTFDFNDDAIPLGVRMMVQLALRSETISANG